MNHSITFRRLALALLFECLLLQRLPAGEWMTWRSTYTHNPMTGQRVDQYSRPVEPVAPDQGNLVKSGYRHYRSTIQAGQSADNLHVVQEWGRPVAPYEHWRFPYRPYGSPYQAWGPQTPSVLGGFGFGFGGLPYGQPFPPGAGQPGAGQPGAGQPGVGQPGLPMMPGPVWGQPGGYPPGGYPWVPGQPYPLVAPFQPAPWYDGFYPSAPPLDNRTDQQFFYRP